MRRRPSQAHHQPGRSRNDFVTGRASTYRVGPDLHVRTICRYLGQWCHRTGADGEANVRQRAAAPSEPASHLRMRGGAVSTRNGHRSRVQGSWPYHPLHQRRHAGQISDPAMNDTGFSPELPRQTRSRSIAGEVRSRCEAFAAPCKKFSGVLLYFPSV
jgi:hypothetical protein